MSHFLFRKKKGVRMAHHEIFDALKEVFYLPQNLFPPFKIILSIIILDVISLKIWGTTLTSKIKSVYSLIYFKIREIWINDFEKKVDFITSKVDLNIDCSMQEGLSFQMSKGIDYDEMSRIVEEKIALLKEEKEKINI